MRVTLVTEVVKNVCADKGQAGRQEGRKVVTMVGGGDWANAGAGVVGRVDSGGEGSGNGAGAGDEGPGVGGIEGEGEGVWPAWWEEGRGRVGPAKARKPKAASAAERNEKRRGVRMGRMTSTRGSLWARRRKEERGQCRKGGHRERACGHIEAVERVERSGEHAAR